jgi:uncharacterized membrane protein
MAAFCVGIFCIVAGACAVIAQGSYAVVAAILFFGLVCIVAGARSMGNKWEKERIEEILKNIRREYYFEYGPELYHQEQEYLDEMEIDRFINLY